MRLRGNRFSSKGLADGVGSKIDSPHCLGRACRNTYIDHSVYPDLDVPPDELLSAEQRAEYVHRICAAWDFGTLPERETFRLFRDWRSIFDRFVSPGLARLWPCRSAASGAAAHLGSGTVPFARLVRCSGLLGITCVGASAEGLGARASRRSRSCRRSACEEPERKPPEPCTPYLDTALMMHDRKPLRILAHGDELLVDGRQEVITESRRSRFVPLVCLGHVGFGFRTNDEARRHRLRLAALRIRARTSSQGAPSRGSFRYASIRRSSSAR